MNVQDATNLSINEGEVRTIHNSAGVQLWGKLSYNTLYKGNTAQDTTTGKNLMPVASYDTSVERNTFLPTLELPAGTYNISFDITSITLGTNTSFDLRLSLRDSDGVDHNIVMVTINANTQLARVNKTFTISYDAVQDARSNVGIIQTAYDAGGRVAVGNIQIEAGSEETAYEPYTGGVPSPNPDYPQTVEVVTGEQTITVSDGTNSTDYTVDLGSIELCKIGNYQDYIYQGSDGWYVHKATGKRDVTTISSIYSSAGIGYIGAQFDVTDMASNSRMNGYCNILIPMNSPSGATTEGITFGAGNKYVYVILKDSRMASSTVPNWNAWLASNTTTIYYPLATPTDTKITDTMLINSLDAVQEWLTRYGYTYSVGGSLPIIIEQNSLT